MASAWIEALRSGGPHDRAVLGRGRGRFLLHRRDHETLIARTKDQHDSAIPSGNGMAATALLRLAALTSRDDLRDKAVQTLNLFHGLIESSPMAAGQMLLGLDFHLGPIEEVVIVGNPREPDTRKVWPRSRQVSAQSGTRNQVHRRRARLGQKFGRETAIAQG